MSIRREREEMAQVAAELGLELQPGQSEEEVGHIAGSVDGFAVEITPDQGAKVGVALHSPLPVFLELVDCGRGARGRLQPFHFGNRVVDGVFRTALAADEVRSTLVANARAIEPIAKRLRRKLNNLVVADGRISAQPRGSHNIHALGRENRLTARHVRDCLPDLIALARALDSLALPPAASSASAPRGGKKRTGPQELQIGLPRPAKRISGLLVMGIIVGGSAIYLPIAMPPGDHFSAVAFPTVGSLISAILLVQYYRLRRWSQGDPRVRFGASEVDIPPLGCGRTGLRLNYADIQKIQVRHFPGNHKKTVIETASGTHVLPNTYFGTVYSRVVGELGCRARLTKTGDTWSRQDS